MSANNGFGVVTNCYVFKSRLQEYAQKVGIPTPVYETVKEGASHEPVFKSTVIVNNVRYDSLPGFFNRKAAEQSAAEIALMEIHKASNMTECMPTVHETGLCKNLLQEYSQKMNYAIPSYICNKQPSGKTPFSCTVEIGGIQYIGAAAKTKKEAEIKAARTALLAIQSNPCGKETNGISQFTVLPGKKKGREPDAWAETVKHIKPKKAKFKVKWSKRRFPQKKGEGEKFNKNGPTIGDSSEGRDKDFKSLGENEDLEHGQLEGSELCPNVHETGNVKDDSGIHMDFSGDLTVETNGHFKCTQLEELNFNESYKGSCSM